MPMKLQSHYAIDQILQQKQEKKSKKKYAHFKNKEKLTTKAILRCIPCFTNI